MRLCERTLVQVWLVRRMHQQGELGGIAECFGEERMPLRASLLPEDGGLSIEERGAVRRERLRLLVPAAAGAAAGDGIWVEDTLWRIRSVQRWTAHVELTCEAI